MLRSLKLQIYLLVFVPLILMAATGIYIKVETLGSVHRDVSAISEQAIIELEKKRLLTVIDAAVSSISEQLEKPGHEGMAEAMALLSRLKYDDGIGYLFAYDADGTRVMHGLGKGVGKNFIDSKDKQGNYIVRRLLKTSRSGDGFTTYYFPKAGETVPSAKYSHARWIDQWGVFIATGFFIDSADAVLADIQSSLTMSSDDSITRSLITLALLSTVMTFIVFLVARAILKPLVNLRQSVEALAQGEGDLASKLPGSPLDILDDIVCNFNRFIEAMAVDIRELKESSHVLTEIALTSIDQSESLEGKSHEQFKETSLIATAIEEMSSTSAEIAKNADLTRETAEVAETEIQDVLQQVELSTEALDELNDVLSGVEDSFHALENNVKAINSVLTVIESVSEQTNLLALNATIEAAHAGDLGRGFAIVAEEVRGLSHRSQQSTVEIKNILNTLQLSANKTMKDMSVSAHKRTAVVDAMHNINNIIHTSTESIKNLTLMNVEVSTAATQQSTVVREMAESITDMSALADFIGKSSHDATVQSARLEKRSKLIEEMTNKFKV